jgi:DNA-binding PadR family transcriptional regulator
VEDGLFSHFIDASFGSIYPALTHLAAEGYVTVREEEQTGKPDKKVYAITEAGRNALARAISVSPAKDKYKSEFLFQMLLQEYLSPEIMLVAIQKQLDDLNEDLGRIAECSHEAPIGHGSHFVADYGNAVLTAGVKCLEYKKAELLQQMAARAAE